jgi:hypothetical protein
MKMLALILGLMVVGCGKTVHQRLQHSYQNSNEFPIERSGFPLRHNGPLIPPLPPKELSLREKAVGNYVGKKDGDALRVVLLANGTGISYVDGKKLSEAKWKIANGEIHAIDEDGDGAVYRINKDGSITLIAWIEGGKREDVQNEDQRNYKKIK